MRKIFDLHGIVSLEGLEFVKKGLAAIDDKLKSTSQQLEETGRQFQKIGKGMTTAFTAPIVAVGVAATKFAGDFEKAMTTSLSIMGDVSDGMKKEMAETAKTVAKETGLSASELAKSYYYLASAGFNAAQSMSALPKVAKFAIAGQFDLQRATDLLTDAQSALGLTTKDVAQNEANMVHVSDVLVKANTLANASVEQFSESLTNRAAAALRILGKDVEEGVAVLAAYADQGTKGAEAGTQLGIVLRDLQRASIKSRSNFDELGISVYDSNGKMNNMADIIGDIEKALSGMSDEQKRATITALGFNDKSVASLLTLIGTSDKIREYEKNLRSAGNTTEDVSKKQLDNFNDKLKTMVERLKVSAISLGQEIIPIIETKVIPTFNKIISTIEKQIEKFGSLSDSHKTLIITIAAITASIGPFIFAMGGVLKILASLRTTVLLLNSAFLANPIGLVTVAVIGLTAAFVALNSQVRKTKDLASDIADQNKNKTVAALEELLHYYDMIKDADKRAISQEVWDEAQKGIKAAKTTLADLGVEFSGNFAKDVEIAKGKLNELKGVAEKGITFESKVINTESHKTNKNTSDLTDKEKAKKAIFEQKEQDKLNKLVSKEMEKRRKIRQKNTDKVIKYEKNEAERVAKIRKENTDKVLAWEKEMEKANAEEIAQNKANIFQSSISAFEGLSNVMSMYYDLQSKKIDNTYDKEHKRIEQLNVSDKRRDELLQQLDDKTEKKRSALRRKAAIAEKVQGVLAIGVNTAVAIMHAWATLPKIAAAIFTGVLSGIGAAQSALITAMPVPAAEGAFIKSRPGGTIVQAGEGRENEVVFPLKTGVKEMVNALIQSISSMPFGSVNNVGSSVATVNHWHIGTLVADDRGCKELERRMSPYSVMDADRKGARV
jgi:TP901 family phage tail tape measure protein